MASSIYEQLGGDVGLQRLVKRFYHWMDTLPEAKGIRQMHPADISTSEEKLYFFLSGWSGGPPLFMEKYGHPRLRARHLPFKIGEAERDQWLACMDRALEDVGITGPLLEQLRYAFFQVADHMRNID